ncbi:MAG: hypothetical protein PHC70_02960 [Patescibacteria group bacterium]|nr:hypothetical protein [Patescibacteria group bacterium]
MTQEKNVSIAYHLKSEAGRLGLPAHEAECSFGLATLPSKQARELTMVRGNTAPPWMNNPGKIQRCYFEVRPMREGKLLGGYPTVRFTCDNNIYIDRGRSPVEIQRSLIRKYIDPSAPGVDLDSAYHWPGKPTIRFWLGKENRVPLDKCAAVLKKFQEGLNIEVERQIISGERDLYQFTSRAPAGSYRPKTRAEQHETDEQGNVLWTGEAFFFLDRIGMIIDDLRCFSSDNRTSTYTLPKWDNADADDQTDEDPDEATATAAEAEDAPKAKPKAARARKNYRWRDRTAVTGKWVEARIAESAEQIVAGSSSVPVITSLILLQDYEEPGRRPIAVLIDAEALKRFIGSFLTDRCNKGYVSRVGGLLFLTHDMIPKEAYDASKKDEQPSGMKKISGKKAPKPAPASAEIVRSGSGGASIGEVLASKGQTLPGQPPPATNGTPS